MVKDLVAIKDQLVVLVRRELLVYQDKLDKRDQRYGQWLSCSTGLYIYLPFYRDHSVQKDTLEELDQMDQM